MEKEWPRGMEAINPRSGIAMTAPYDGTPAYPSVEGRPVRPSTDSDSPSEEDRTYLARAIPLHRKTYGARPNWDRTNKYRHWVFTIQGWNDTQLELIRSNPAWRYVIIGKETGELGTQHYQGFGSFASQRYHASVKRIVGGAWCEPAVNVDACITYCKKEGDFVEGGTAPQSAEQSIQGIYDTISEIENEYDDDLVSVQDQLDMAMFSLNEHHPYLPRDEDEIEEEYDAFDDDYDNTGYFKRKKK